MPERTPPRNASPARRDAARLHRFSSTAPTVSIAPGVVIEEDEPEKEFDAGSFDAARRVAARRMALVAAFAGATWAILGVLIFVYDIGSYPTWFPGRVLAYVLLVLAPGLTFTPIGVRLGLRYYAPLATLCWAILGFLVGFVAPNTAGGGSDHVVPLVGFLALCLGALTVLFMPFFYALGLRFLVWRLHRYDIGRAQREGFLTALFVILLVFLRGLDSLSTLNGALLFLVFCIIEALFLSRHTV